MVHFLEIQSTKCIYNCMNMAVLKKNLCIDANIFVKDSCLYDPVDLPDNKTSDIIATSEK